MKDYILQVKVKNGPMLRAMRAAGFETASALALASRTQPGEVGSYLNLTVSPINQSGEWRPSLLRIATTLHSLPEDLFPSQHVKNPLRINRAEFEASLEDIGRFQIAQDNDPQEALEKKEEATALFLALASLSPREQEVLRMRYGLDDGEERTLRDIGLRLGISRPRVDQIEAKALRKLRHPTRAVSRRLVATREPIAHLQ